MTTRGGSIVLAALMLGSVAAACGSSKSGSGGSSGATETIGILTDASGLGASGNETTVQGVAAGIVEAAKAGIHIKYVVGDTETTPSGALAAAHALVQEDHVNAIVAVSALTFTAASYLSKQSIPVVGAAEDGSEWTTSKNMFSVYGYPDESAVYTTAGQLFKMEGATSVGTLGYSISPSSSESAKSTSVAAKDVGLKAPYVNAAFSFGSTNVQPVALAMKGDGVDSVYSATDPNTSFSLLTALRQEGVHVKVAYFPTGYGGDITQAGPNALQVAQGAIFSTVTWEPIAMNTSATQQFTADLAAAGVKGQPTESEYNGYASVAALVAALKTTGANPSHAALTAALAAQSNFTAWGLTGNLHIDLNNRSLSSGVPAAGCQYFSKLVGSVFQPIPGGDPLCGTFLERLSS
ncbi:MAG TPA: ABC transporter substrate-binding protein [Acidimicrobiales bacterium]|nr:ABC transporter substrate-binding protein [Acidimicrobiales bacterium]